MVVLLVFYGRGAGVGPQIKNFPLYHVCEDWRCAGHAEIQGLGKGAQQTEKHLPDPAEATSVSGDQGLISYFKIGN